ncbi:T9SS sorting signal type C domain-containing protein [Flavobacterium sp.]|uniref:T9SS sorting signal type C domain-containing protein n=1 Tax=Flavobacterium sp. TaxID=239 RepID=UPI004047720A
MKKKYFIKIVCIASLFFQYSFAQTNVFVDYASNYSSWTNGSNLGTGFSNWDLWTQNTDATHFAGHFLGNSLAQGFGDINSSGSSFSMYANPTGVFVQANAQRFLSNTGSPSVGGRQYLLPGQSFKIDLAIAYRNGYKGIDLMDQNFGLLFNFNVGSDLYSTSTNSDLGWVYNQNSIFQLQVNQVDVTSYEVIISRDTDIYYSGIRTGQFSGFKLYVGNTDSNNDLNNLHFNNLLVQKCAMTTTWDGVSWDKGEPNSNKNVVFTGNYNSTSNLSACSVQVANNAIVVINSNHNLTVENGIEVSSGSDLVFENNASLLQNNPTATNLGNITYKRNATPMIQYQYTYWGSPVLGQKLNLFSPLTSTARFYSFNANPTVNNWVTENPNSAMIPAKGYAIMAPQNYNSTPAIFNGVFKGVPNNGNYSYNVFEKTVSNYNLLSNPYPSAINVQTLIANTTLKTLYYWTHNTAISANVFSSNDYAVRTSLAGTAANSGGVIPTKYMAAGQGFFASSTATGTVTFTNSMRVAGTNSDFFRNPDSQNETFDEADDNLIRLDLSNSGGAFKQQVILYVTGATDDYDSGMDGDQLDGQFVSFYSIIPGHNLAIQAKAMPWQVTDQVPLGFKSTITASTSFDISISELGIFFSDKDVFIEDKVENVFHDLKAAPYTFSSVAGVFDDRFVIHYQDASLSSSDFSAYQSSVYLFNENKLPKMVSTKSNIASIIAYDMLGRVVFSKDNINASEVSLSGLINNNQALLIKATLENNITVVKKFIF